MHSRSRHVFLLALPLALLALSPLAPVLAAAEPVTVEDRFRALESRLTALEQENAALRRELGHPPSSPSSASAPPLPPSPRLPLAPSPGLLVPPSPLLSVSPSPPLPPSSLRFAADLRTRFSSIMYAAPAAATRDQLLFQFRAGFVGTLGDTLEGGVRFTAGDLNSTFGGSPLSAQFTASDNASRKTAFIDQLFVRWKPTLADGASAAFTLGKAANPFFTPSRILFDNDYNPEGATEEFSFAPAPDHRLSLAAGQYILDELAASARDPLLLAARARWEAHWQPTWSTTLGLAQLTITHPAALTATNVANNNRGNTRSPAGELRYDYRPLFAEASVTHLLDRAPGYPGKFPVSVFAEFLRNPGAPAQRDAWTAGLTLGRSGQAGQWEFGYRYVRVEADAWFEEMLEGDYAAYYHLVPPGWNTDPTSLTGGPGNGSNTRSHVFRTSYSPRDYLLFSANLFLNDLAHRPAGNASDTAAQRLQLETLIRF